MDAGLRNFITLDKIVLANFSKDYGKLGTNSPEQIV